MNNVPIDMEKAKKYSFRVRLREVFTDGLLTNLKWNFLFVLTSLPVFTMGASMAALSHCTNLLVKDDRVQYCAAKIYFAAFRQSLKKTIPLGLVILVLNTVLGFGLHFYIQMMGQIIMFVPMASLSLLVIIAVWSVIIHLMPSLFEDTDFDEFTVKVTETGIKELTAQAGRTALITMKKTLIALVISAVILALQLLYMPLTIPIVLTLGIAIPAQICAFSHTEPEILDY
ncbi:MAG: DUF624 domain-containing protein [Ruminococcaceae bacterium]|nr:DUF624 domain-containing protein [Oscillospiraceae bacterium]